MNEAPTRKLVVTTCNGDTLEVVANPAETKKWENEVWRKESNIKNVWTTPLDGSWAVGDEIP